MNVDGSKAPQDWVNEGWFQVRIPAGETRSEKLEDGVDEVRPELWREDGMPLGREDLPAVNVKGDRIELERALDVDVYVVAARTAELEARQEDEPELKRRERDEAEARQRVASEPRRVATGPATTRGTARTRTPSPRPTGAR